MAADPPAGNAGRVLLLSTERGAGSGAYRILEYFLAAAAGAGLRDRLLIAAPADSDVFRTATRLELSTLAWPAACDALLHHLRAAARLGRPEGVTRVHAWHTRGFEPALWLARRWEVPCTGTLHDHPTEGGHGFWRLRLMRLSARRQDGLAAVGEALARAWRPFVGDTPLRVIPNGLPDLAPPIRLPKDRVRLGFAGLYSPTVKGWPLVRAWIERSRREQWPVAWRLFGLAAGEHALAAELRALREAAPDGFLEAEGFVPSDRIFSAIDLLVHPSQVFDSYPTLLLEAARAGAPALCSDIGGSAEIVEHGLTGRVFPAADAEAGFTALRELAHDRAALAAMGAAARAAYERRHRPESMVAGYAALWGFSGAQPRI